MGHLPDMLAMTSSMLGALEDTEAYPHRDFRRAMLSGPRSDGSKVGRAVPMHRVSSPPPASRLGGSRLARVWSSPVDSRFVDDVSARLGHQRRIAVNIPP